MKVYLYAKSGHAIGLDATRRASAITKLLQKKNLDPILCTCDFRAGAYAKEELGIKKYVSVDVLSNLPNMMQRGDILIYETDEASEFMEGHMKEFSSLLYKIPDDIPYNIIDKEFFYNQTNKNIEKLMFFGDDDYDELFLQMCLSSRKQDISLLLGHYFFLGSEDKLKAYFNEIFEEEDYINCIQNTKYLLSGSFNACLESIACNNNPILLKRKDKEYNEDLISSLNLPVIESSNLDEIMDKFDEIVKNYPSINQPDEFDIEKIINEISNKVEQFNKLI